MMRFIVHKNDFDFESVDSHISNGLFLLTANTSVNTLKRDYFLLLSQIGEIVQINNNTPYNEIKELCLQDDVIYACVNGFPPDNLKCRLLSHSLGSFMISGGFLNGWETRKTTVNVVTSEIQKQQMIKGLGKACPQLCVVTPQISDADFHFPKEILERPTECYTLLYAGRLIANKGIAQTVRALNFWETPQMKLFLTGDFEEDFFIYHSNTYHTTFPLFFEKEIIQQNKNPKLYIQKHNAVSKDKLKEHYWKADCLVYPSFHEDENFGYVPREAMLCGTPAVVTDFCGLGQLKNSKSKTIKTYSSLAGVRYSLKELYDSIIAVSKCSKHERAENAIINKSFVVKESDTNSSLTALKQAAEYLLSLEPEAAPEGGWRDKRRIDRLAHLCPEKFSKAIGLKGTLPQEGLYVDGSGFPPEGRWFSEAHFMQAIQSLYTSIPIVPEVKKGYIYRGFWRIQLWTAEQAIVEFGFPGPRIKRFDKEDFLFLQQSCINKANTEPVFQANDKKVFSVLQTLLELGYIVPDIID